MKILLTRFVLIIILLFLIFLICFKSKETFYNKNNKISVILISYKRPWNLNKSIPQLVKNKYIDEIIILHGHKEHVNKINHKKVRNINNWEDNDKIYTLRRFKNIDLCKNEIVMILDDDLIPSDKLINIMLSKFSNNPENIYGNFIRYCNSNGYFHKKDNNNSKDLIVLTGLFLTSKKIVKRVWSEMNTPKNKKFLDLIVKQKGNCEDIFFNHIFKQLYKKTPEGIVSFDHTNLDTSNGFWSNDSNLSNRYRDNFCKKISIN